MTTEKLGKTYYTSSVSPKGQITLPKQLREELHIEPRDIVVIALEDGRLQIESAKSRLRAVYRSIPALDPPRDWGEVTQDAWETLAAHNADAGRSDENTE